MKHLQKMKHLQQKRLKHLQAEKITEAHSTKIIEAPKNEAPSTKKTLKHLQIKSGASSKKTKNIIGASLTKKKEKEKRSTFNKKT